MESTGRTCGYSHAYRNPFAYLAAIYPVAICQRENRELAYTFAYEKYNTLAWELISHLWFLLVLVILTTVSIGIFTWFQKRQETSKPRPAAISLAKLSLIFFLLGMAYAAIRRIIFIVYPAILSDGMFNFIVMQTLFYVPFFILGALAFIHPI